MRSCSIYQYCQGDDYCSFADPCSTEEEPSGFCTNNYQCKGSRSCAINQRCAGESLCANDKENIKDFCEVDESLNVLGFGKCEDESECKGERRCERFECIGLSGCEEEDTQCYLDE